MPYMNGEIVSWNELWAAASPARRAAMKAKAAETRRRNARVRAAEKSPEVKPPSPEKEPFDFLGQVEARWAKIKARAYHVSRGISPWTKSGRVIELFWVIHDPMIREFAFGGNEKAIVKTLKPTDWDRVRWPYFPAIEARPSVWSRPQSVAFAKPSCIHKKRA